jgi:hypothetical protein
VIFKDAARRAGLKTRQVARIAGHSARIGATHELPRAGASLAQLMRCWRVAIPRKCRLPICASPRLNTAPWLYGDVLMPAAHRREARLR